VDEHFGRDRSRWSPGRPGDDGCRAGAAYLARRRFGYPAVAVSKALDYRGHSSLRYALNRVETGPVALRRTVKQLEGKLD